MALRFDLLELQFHLDPNFSGKILPLLQDHPHVKIPVLVFRYPNM